MRRPSAPRWWQRLSLRAKTMVVTVVPVALIVLAVPLISSVQRETSSLGNAVEHVYRVRQSIAIVLQDLVDAETGVRGYVITGDAAFLGPYREGIGAVQSDVTLLGQRLGADPIAHDRFERLRELVDQRVEILERTRVFAVRTPAGEEPDDLVNHGRLVMDQIRDVLAQLDAHEAAALAAARARSERADRSAFLVTVIAIPVALLLTVLFGLGFTTRLVRSIRRIEENARRLERGEPLLEPPNGDDELARLGLALGHAAARIAEQERELRELALVDELTELPNRRAFMQIAAHELQVAIRRSSVTALMFVDADGLKDVNDRFGHAEGDAMLQELAGILRSQLRAADLVARIGGDEFVVLLSRDTLLDGTDVLERLRTVVRRRNEEPTRPYALDFSVGIAFFDPLNPVDVDELIQQADAEMYAQKRAKRLSRADA